ncbi:MAG: 3'-5' exonuclease [Bacteroidota bacterium]|nr:3'-5' exonuclease [Bacteroidota bacterium]
MRIHLKKPILFFDLETTGTDVNTSRIIEISCLKFNPDETRTELTYILNPGIPIPKKTSEIHGFYDSDVLDKPLFKDISQELLTFFNGCDLGGYNCIYFDIPLLAEEFYRCGISFPDNDTIYIDPMRIFQKREPRTLGAAYKFYCDKDLLKAHSAKADTEAAAEIFIGQLQRYSDLGETIEAIGQTFNDPQKVDFAGKLKLDNQGDIIYAFGKHIGQKVKDNLYYAAWMLKSDFPGETKRHLEKLVQNN